MSISQQFDGTADHVDDPHYFRDSKGNQLIGPADEGFGVLIPKEEKWATWYREGLQFTAPRGWTDEDRPVGALPFGHQPKPPLVGESAARFFADDDKELDDGSTDDDEELYIDKCIINVLIEGKEEEEVTTEVMRAHEDDDRADYHAATLMLRTLRQEHPDAEVAVVSTNAYDIQGSHCSALVFIGSKEKFRSWMGIEDDAPKPIYTKKRSIYHYCRNKATSRTEFGQWDYVVFHECSGLLDLVTLED